MQMMLTCITHQNNLASTHIENMHTETLLVNQTSNIMTLTIKTLSHSQINVMTDNIMSNSHPGENIN